MPRPITSFLAIALLATAAPAGAMAGENGLLHGPVPAVVERVVDGDTLDVRAIIWLGQELHVRVRLRDVDAPELGSHCPEARAVAERARAALDHLLQGRVVSLVEISAQGGFGRVLAGVRTPAGEDAGQALLQQGLAKPYAPKGHCRWCAADHRSCALQQAASSEP